MAEKYQIKRFINTGTFFEDCFDNTYSMSKKMFELSLKEWSKKKDNKVLNLTLYHSYGERDNNKVIPYMIKNILNNKKFELDNFNQEMNPIYINDIINVYIEGISYIDQIKDFDKVHICASKNITLINILNTIEFILNKKAKIKFKENKNELISFNVPKKMNKNFNWTQEYTLYEGLKETIKYYKSKENKNVRNDWYTT